MKLKERFVPKDGQGKEISVESFSCVSGDKEAGCGKSNKKQEKGGCPLNRSHLYSFLPSKQEEQGKHSCFCSWIHFPCLAKCSSLLLKNVLR